MPRTAVVNVATGGMQENSMAGEFTTWAVLRTAILDALAAHVAGAPCTGSYTIGSRTMTYRSFEELTTLYEKTYTLERLENMGTIQDRISYGRHRRFD
jgi:hypothetical protein